MEFPQDDLKQLKHDIYSRGGIMPRLATLEERVEAIKSIDRKLWGVILLVIAEFLKSFIMK